MSDSNRLGFSKTLFRVDFIYQNNAIYHYTVSADNEAEAMEKVVSLERESGRNPLTVDYIEAEELLTLETGDDG